MLTWLVYALAALVMLTAAAGAILVGLGLRFVAEFLRGYGETQQEGDYQKGRKD
jgi:putative Mn2+ efflux pump MntP